MQNDPKGPYRLAKRCFRTCGVGVHFKAANKDGVVCGLARGVIVDKQADGLIHGAQVDGGDRRLLPSGSLTRPFVPALDRLAAVRVEDLIPFAPCAFEEFLCFP